LSAAIISCTVDCVEPDSVMVVSIWRIHPD